MCIRIFVNELSTILTTLVCTYCITWSYVSYTIRMTGYLPV